MWRINRWDMKVPDSKPWLQVRPEDVTCDISLYMKEKKQDFFCRNFFFAITWNANLWLVFSWEDLLILIQMDHHFIPGWAKPTALNITIPFRFFQLHDNWCVLINYFQFKKHNIELGWWSVLARNILQYHWTRQEVNGVRTLIPQFKIEPNVYSIDF